MKTKLRTAKAGRIHAAILLLSLCLLCGCDRVQEFARSLGDRLRPGPGTERSGKATDTERVLRKFGEPKERLGVGRRPESENGISHNKKWNYYYSVRNGGSPAMRTVYFLDGRFVGSVIREADGTIRRETVRFSW